MKKGISMLTLGLTIIILVIVTSVVVVSSKTVISSTIKKSFAEEMYSIKNLVEDYEFKHEEYPVKDTVITFDLSSISSENVDQFSEENAVNNEIKLYEIDLARVGVDSVNVGNGKTSYDIYAYSLDTNNIYYLKGKKISDKLYYTLTDELYYQIGISEVK